MHLSASTSPLDSIRQACAFVAARAERVHIDPAQLRAYAAALPVEQIGAPASNPLLAALAPDAELRAAFVCTLDAVNFGSGYFPLLRKRPGHSGYRTIEAELLEHFAARGPLRAAALAEIGPERCAELFGQRLEGPIGELMARFAAAWRELGAHLLCAHGGSFAALLDAAEGSAERLVRELAQLSSYHDVAQYQGRAVPFLKRAQITAADLAAALPDRRFRDLDRLTLFADNLVPHVLRMDGVLVYAGALLERIDREEPIEAGSPEEVEIRACAVHAVEELCEAVRRKGVALAPYQLDSWLWLRGGGAFYKARPRHRTRSWFY